MEQGGLSRLIQFQLDLNEFCNDCGDTTLSNSFVPYIKAKLNRMLNNEKAKNLLFDNMNVIEKSQQIAENNYSACIRQMPRSLIASQKKLFKMIKKSNHDPIKMLGKLYAYMDDLNRYVQGYTPCKKGCSNCCCIPISVTELDVCFIERSLGMSRNIQKLLILPEIPCPFLVFNACSIYRYRPLVCRKNVTFDASSRWCHAKIGANAPMPSLQLNIIEQIYYHLANMSGANTIFDIREIFVKQSDRPFK